MTPAQVESVLTAQRTAARPFGELAERMFDVPAKTVEQAWTDQYLMLGTEIDLSDETADPDVLRLLNRRQAWQFHMLPLRREDATLLVVTHRDALPRACRFAWRQFKEPVCFLIADAQQLESTIQSCYPWPAMRLPSL